jgi:large subunit ribosomal protein L9
MQVILLKDIEKLGDRFEVVSVKPGYGRNYLIPQGFAQVANKGNMEKLDEIKAREAALEAQRSAEYQALIAKLEAQSLTIGAKAGASGKIFGSVTNVQIAAAIKDTMGLDIERKKIDVPEDIKELGSYVAEVNLYRNMVAKVRFDVVAE